MQDDPDKLEDKVAEIANLIERYLSSHPDAADTLNGVRSWWLEPKRHDHPRQCHRHRAIRVVRGRAALTSRPAVESNAETGRAPGGTRPRRQ